VRNTESHIKLPHLSALMHNRLSGGTQTPMNFANLSILNHTSPKILPATEAAQKLTALGNSSPSHHNTSSIIQNTIMNNIQLASGMLGGQSSTKNKLIKE
jgi:hypothetical protein